MSMRQGEAFPATVLRVGEIYYHEGEHEYYQVETVTHDGPFVTIGRHGQPERRYPYCFPVIILDM